MMTRWNVLVAALLVCGFLALGCSGGGNPASPVTPDLTGASSAKPVQTHLWGYYDVYIDIPTQTATAVLNRNVMFAANVVQFVNGSAANLGFNIIGTPVDPGGEWVDVDIDVSVTHPFAGMAMYNGYDVRGIFIGNGSKTMKYDTQLKYAALKGADQEMYDYDGTSPDPHAGLVGNPDGYTRWWNPKEFTTPGLFGYTPGLFASGGYTATATLNPYKYFADTLTVTGDLWSYLTTTTKDGVFSSGQTNVRNYYLRFPTPTPGVMYSYAIVANWIDETTHPANAPEAVGLNVGITPDVYYASASDKGGSLKLDIDFATQWSAVPTAIFVESTVLTNKYQFSPSEMVPVGGGVNYSTYHVEILANNITGNSTTVNSEFWVIPQYDGYDYKNTFGVTNGAGSDKLAAFFRYDLFVAGVAYNKPPTCAVQVVGPQTGYVSVSCKFTTIGSGDPDPGDTITYAWDFDGDGVYGEVPDDDYTGTPDTPIHKYTASYAGNVNLKVTDNKGASSICSVAVNIIVKPLFNEKFNSSPADWAYYNYKWEGCANQGAPGWTTVAPFGPSGSGNVRWPPTGNYSAGGDLGTVVTVPFDIPTGASEVNLRVYYCQAFAGGWYCFRNMNWKMVESSTPGMSPFNQSNAALPSGGVYLQNATTHGSSFGAYLPNPCYCYGPMYGQPGWPNSMGGGAFPGSLTGYFDLILPASWYGKTVKVAIQYQSDECGYGGTGMGYALDDYEVKLY
jgi:hypothetical protein